MIGRAATRAIAIASTGRLGLKRRLPERPLEGVNAAGSMMLCPASLSPDVADGSFGLRPVVSDFFFTLYGQLHCLAAGRNGELFAYVAIAIPAGEDDVVTRFKLHLAGDKTSQLRNLL